MSTINPKMRKILVMHYSQKRCSQATTGATAAVRPKKKKHSKNNPIHGDAKRITSPTTKQSSTEYFHNISLISFDHFSSRKSIEERYKD